MRQHPRRSRGRGNNNNNRRQSNNRHQVYDSNGPDGKIRGSAQQVYEKYLAAARDAASSGDRIAAESFYQHAEHYYRIHAAANEDSSKQDCENNRRGSRSRQDRDQNDETTDNDGNDKPEETIIEDGSEAEMADAGDSDDNDHDDTGRGRGRGRGRSTRGNSRRRKADDDSDSGSDDAVAAENDGDDTEAEAKPARRRGRPPKAASAVAQLMSEVEGNVKETEEA